MPNLLQLRQKVYRAIDFNPQLEAYKDGITADLNDAYIHLSTQYKWLFMKKESTINLRREANNTNTSGTIEITSANLRLVTFTTATPSSEWEGQTFVGPDDTEITIGAVSGQDVYLVEAYAAAVAAGETDWQVKFNNYLLPRDCAEARAFYSKADDTGLLEFVDNDNEEYMYFDEDQTGRSRFVVEGHPVFLLPPETAPALTVVSGGTLNASQEYEYCYTFYYKGVESPPSPAARATTTGANKTINLSELPTTYWSAGTKASGKIKKVYRRRTNGDGVWVFIGNVADGTATLSDDGTLVGMVVEERQESSLLYEEGPRQAIRAWWTPDETLRAIKLRYQRRPRPLISDSDVPEWPVQYHYLIAWWALREICLQHGMPQQAKHYASLAQPLLNQMKAKYLTRSARRRVKRSWAGGTVYQSIYGRPSKT